QGDPREAVIERENIVELSKGHRPIGEVRAQTARRVVDDRDVRARERLSECIGKKVSERRPRIAGATNRGLNRDAKRGGLEVADTSERRRHRLDDSGIGLDRSSFVLRRHGRCGRWNTLTRPGILLGADVTWGEELDPGDGPGYLIHDD